MTVRILWATMLSERAPDSAVRVSVIMYSPAVRVACWMAVRERVESSASDLAGRGAADGEIQISGFIDEKDVAALDFGELEGGFDQRGEDLVDGADGIELARRFEEPAQLFKIGVWRGDGLDLAEQIADCGMAAADLGVEAKHRAVDGAEMDAHRWSKDAVGQRECR